MTRNIHCDLFGPLCAWLSENGQPARPGL